MPVNNPFALVAGQQYADGTPSSATNFTGTVAMSFNGTDIVGLRSDASDNLYVNIAASSTLTVQGALTHNAAAPAANNIGVLPAVASSAAPTYNAGDQVLLSTDLAGNLRVNATFTGTATNNITQWNSVNLGSPSAYGTSPGAVNVIGVNAFVTNTVTVTGTVAATQSGAWTVAATQSGSWTVAVSGTVAVTQSTSPWIVAGALTNNNAAPTATLIGVMDHIAETAYTTVTYTTGDVVLATTDLHGATNVDLQALAGTALGAGSNYGTSPGAVNVMGVNAFITNTPAVTVSGTVGVTQSTSPWVVSLTSTTITGTVAVTQSTSPWVVAGGLTHNNAAPTANNVGVLPAVASTAAPTYTAGDQVLLSTDLAGNLRVTFAAASEQNVNVNQWAGTTLGTPTNFGTTPGAVVAGSVNASLFAGTTALSQTGGSLNVDVTNTVPVTLTSTTITGTVAVTQSTTPWVVAGALTNNNAAPTATLTGVLPAIAETAYNTVTYTTGDMVLPVTDLHGALNQDLQAYAGTQLTGTVTAYGTAPTGNVFGVNAFVTNPITVTFPASPVVWIEGHAGAALDSAQNAAAPANELVVGGVYNTTVPSITAGNATQLQTDSRGALQVTSLDGGRVTYRVASGTVASNVVTPTFTPATGVLFQLQGSASKTIRITRFVFTVSATAAGAADLTVTRRTSATTGGTTVTPTIMREDTNDAAATAVATYWTSSAGVTLGTITGGPYFAERIMSESSSSAGGHRIDVPFGNNPGGKAFVLRGTGDYFTVALTAFAGTAPIAEFWCEWTEE